MLGMLLTVRTYNPTHKHAYLWEEKARDPVHVGCAAVHPGLDEAAALKQVIHPRRQGLEGRVGFSSPDIRHLRQRHTHTGNLYTLVIAGTTLSPRG